MKNRIYALRDSFPSLGNLKKKMVWRLMAKYLLLIPLMLLTIPLVFCLFHKIIICCITKYMTEPPTEMMTRLEALDQMYSLIYDQ